MDVMRGADLLMWLYWNLYKAEHLIQFCEKWLCSSQRSTLASICWNSWGRPLIQSVNRSFSSWFFKCHFSCKQNIYLTVNKAPSHEKSHWTAAAWTEESEPKAKMEKVEPQQEQPVKEALKSVWAAFFTSKSLSASKPPETHGGATAASFVEVEVWRSLASVFSQTSWPS